MNRKVLIVLVILLLLAVPTVLFIASGDFFQEKADPYDVGIISVKEKATVFMRNAIDGLYDATQSETMEIHGTLYYTADMTPESMFDAVTRAVDDQADMVLSAGYGSDDPLLRAALLYPDREFVIVDGDLTDNLPENCANIVFRSNEPSFIAGYLAGRMTDTGTVGFLGGIPTDSVQTFYYGFSAGVQAAAASSGKNIHLITEYTDSFTDQEAGYARAKLMYDEGADIIFTVAGDSGLGGIRAAKELNKYVIGVDNDQNYLAPLNVLFSVTKNVSGAVSDVVMNYAKDHYAVNQGVAVKEGHLIRDETGRIEYGYAEDGVGISSIIDAVPLSLIIEKNVIEQRIRDGEITIPATREEYDAWTPLNLAYIV